MNRRAFQGRRAFTLVEVLAAMVFIGILVPVILSALNVSTRAAVASERGAVALQLTENKLNELLLDNPWASGGARGDFGDLRPGYRWELESADAPDASGMTVLTMVVYYQVQGQEHSVELSTLVQTEVST